MIGSIGISRVVGLVRMRVFANEFGATPATDAYVMAFALPDFVFLLVGGGVIASALVPYFAERIHAGDERQAWHTFSALMTVVGGALAMLLGVLFIAAPRLMPLLVQNLDPAVHSLCVDLARIMLFGQVFMFFGGLAMGALNAKQHFLVPAVGPILYNLCIIAGILLFAGQAGLYAAAWAVLIGAFASNVVLQVAVLRRLGASLRPILDWRDEGLRRCLLFMGPVILSLCVIHIDTLFSKWLATHDTYPGATTCLENAYRLAMVPVGMFAMGAGVAAFPTLAESVARHELAEFIDHLSLSLRSVLFLTIPTVALMGSLAFPIVRLIYEGGQFDIADSNLTAAILICFAVGIVGLAGQQFFPRAFYAFNDSRTPCLIGVASVGAHVAIALVLFPTMGVVGCALATAISSSAAFALMLILLRRRVGAMDGRRVLTSTAKITLASALAALLGYATYAWMHASAPSSGGRSLLWEALVPCLAGIAAYAALVRVFRIEEGIVIARLFRRRSGAANS